MGNCYKLFVLINLRNTRAGHKFKKKIQPNPDLAYKINMNFHSTIFNVHQKFFRIPAARTSEQEKKTNVAFIH